MSGVVPLFPIIRLHGVEREKVNLTFNYISQNTVLTASDVEM